MSTQHTPLIRDRLAGLVSDAVARAQTAGYLPSVALPEITIERPTRLRQILHPARRTDLRDDAVADQQRPLGDHAEFALVRAPARTPGTAERKQLTDAAD